MKEFTVYSVKLCHHHCCRTSEDKVESEPFKVLTLGFKALICCRNIPHSCFGPISRLLTFWWKCSGLFLKLHNGLSRIFRELNRVILVFSKAPLTQKIKPIHYSSFNFAINLISLTGTTYQSILSTAHHWDQKKNKPRYMFDSPNSKLNKHSSVYL